MSTVFSGSWQADNQPLMAQLSRLACLAQSEFDIEISIEKMLQEIDYRQLVISELTQLAQPDINLITSWLNAIEKSSDKNGIIKVQKRSLRLLLTLALLVSAISTLWYLNSLQSHNSSIKPKAHVTKTISEPNSSLTNSSSIKTSSSIEIPSTSVKPYFACMVQILLEKN